MIRKLLYNPPDTWFTLTIDKIYIQRFDYPYESIGDSVYDNFEGSEDSEWLLKVPNIRNDRDYIRVFIAAVIIR